MTIQSFLTKHSIFVEAKHFVILNAMVNEEIVLGTPKDWMNVYPYLMSIARQYKDQKFPRQSSLEHEQDSSRSIN